MMYNICTYPKEGGAVFMKPLEHSLTQVIILFFRYKIRYVCRITKIMI